MAFKIRIMASHGKPGRGPVPRIIYKAEAYEEGDQFRERKWQCVHDHETVEHAFNCGMVWLGDQTGPAPGGRVETA